jgi:hypothetical protein
MEDVVFQRPFPPPFSEVRGHPHVVLVHHLKRIEPDVVPHWLGMIELVFGLQQRRLDMRAFEAVL